MGNIKQGWSKKVRDKKSGGISFCDRTDMAYNYGDLIKEYEWRGNSLVWNGLMVGHDVADEPNESGRPFKYKKEGILPPNARPEQQEIPAMSNQETLEVLKNTVWQS